jgi:FkbM family methyltransferase
LHGRGLALAVVQSSSLPHVCADVGANIGMKSLLLSQYVPHGRVLAIEPAPTIVSLLEQNIARSGYPNITVVNTAIGDSNGTVCFTENSAYGHICDEGVEVPVRRLSSLTTELQLQRLDFVKIDVEGYEFPILRSSLDLLNHHQSLVLFEFNAWCQIALASVNPKEFAEWIFGHFSNVFRVHRGVRGDDYLERLSADGALHFLHTNLVHDRVISDLLITNFEGRLSPVPNRLQPELKAAIAGRDAALVERDAAIAGQDAASVERDAAIAGRDAALVKRDALLRSNSWRITAPIRALSSIMRIRSLKGQHPNPPFQI